MATLAIDFDGTIHDWEHPVKVMGPPMPGAVEGMKELDMQGHKLVVFTARGNSTYVWDWLRYFGIPCSEVTNTKDGGFDCFFDDRNFPHFDPEKSARVWRAYVDHVTPYHGRA